MKVKPYIAKVTDNTVTVAKGSKTVTLLKIKCKKIMSMNMLSTMQVGLEAKAMYNPLAHLVVLKNLITNDVIKMDDDMFTKLISSAI